MYPELPASTDTFYGRDIELRKMEELLGPGKPGQKGVVLCGIGGSGKIHYAPLHYETQGALFRIYMDQRVNHRAHEAVFYRSSGYDYL